MCVKKRDSSVYSTWLKQHELVTTHSETNYTAQYVNTKCKNITDKVSTLNGVNSTNKYILQMCHVCMY